MIDSVEKTVRRPVDEDAALVHQQDVYRRDARPELFERPAIFLSASVPYLRDRDNPAKLPPGYREADNRRWVDTAEERRIRKAVSQLCRFAFRHDVDLVFGGHPAITPMVLESARIFGGEERKRVVVFQSLFFETEIPEETYNLARWDLGTPLWTAKEGSRWTSLTTMRREMLASPNLIAAVFVGGMEGLLQEAELFPSDGLCFAVGSTGGAARDLLLLQDGFSGEHADREILGEKLSYPLVMSRIFQDLAL